jgi:hypothetical protein
MVCLLPVKCKHELGIVCWATFTVNFFEKVKIWKNCGVVKRQCNTAN